MAPFVVTDTIGDVRVITLNRPEVINALNLQARAELQAALDEFDGDTSVRIGVITGANGNFCAGQDLKATANGEPVHSDRESQLVSFARVSTKKVVIAAVEGYALAGGFELALSCDLIVAAESARFGLPEVKHNLVAIGGGLIRLPRRIPYHAAMMMALTGDRVAAAQMKDWGALAEVCSDGEALRVAIQLANRIAANGPSAVRATKEIIRRNHDFGNEAMAFETQLAIAAPALESSDVKEGVSAFLDRRTPEWGR